MTESPKQRRHRARALLALAAVAFVIGAALGATRSGDPEESLATRFVSAWTHHQFAAMYSDLAASSKHATSASAFAQAYGNALMTATATREVVLGAARAAPAGEVAVPVRVRTRLFGALTLRFEIPFTQEGGAPRVAWSRSLAFPGLHAGELLTRETYLPARAPLLDRDGGVLAEAEPGSPSGTPPAEATPDSPLGPAADAVLGEVGAIPAAQRQQLEEQGLPANAIIGLSGLELAFDARLRGTPGGVLLAGTRVLARAEAHAAPPLRTSVSAPLQQSAVEALGSQLGGVVAMQPSTGQILAVAGLGLDALQPPGSTFKMVTTTGVLSSGIADEGTVFRYATYATLDGVRLNNANGEECGGTLALAFAVSCNSVFSPLGVKLGAARLVATAERFGFNHPPGLPGAAESSLPPASRIQGELDVGSTAIGQGQVLATPLEMATVAATIADGGQRPQPTFTPSKPATSTRVMSVAVAHTMRRLMIGVVREGTGTAAAIPGVTVAGKTGTAELKTLCASAAGEGGAHAAQAPKEGCGGESEAANTDAWFAAFAPALHPRIVVCVMLVKDGAGGATAAPAARGVIEAAL